MEKIIIATLVALFLYTLFKLNRSEGMLEEVDLGTLTPLNEELEKLREAKWDTHRRSKLISYLEEKGVLMENESGTLFVRNFQRNLTNFREDHQH